MAGSGLQILISTPPLGPLHRKYSRALTFENLCQVKAATSDSACVEARESLDLINARAVNRWHYRMINDAARNQSYEDALRRAVRRHAASDPVAVLDIGAGTGLLAMYAAKV